MGILLTMAIGLAAAPPPASGARQETASRVIFDETDYCRARVQFGMDRLSPDALRAEGKKVLGERGMWLVKRAAKGFLGKQFAEAIWPEFAFHSFQWLQYGGSRDRANPYAYTAPPPGDWMQPGFDDSGWLWQRKPFMVGRTYGWFRRAGFFRFRFVVGDVSEAGRLTLEMIYRGGARVYLNGHEIARGHLRIAADKAPAVSGLPKGLLRGPLRGQDYPLGAYVRLTAGAAPSTSTSASCPPPGTRPHGSSTAAPASRSRTCGTSSAGTSTARPSRRSRRCGTASSGR